MSQLQVVVNFKCKSQISNCHISAQSCTWMKQKNNRCTFSCSGTIIFSAGFVYQTILCWAFLKVFVHIWPTCFTLYKLFHICCVTLLSLQLLWAWPQQKHNFQRKKRKRNYIQQDPQSTGVLFSKSAVTEEELVSRPYGHLLPVIIENLLGRETPWFLRISIHPVFPAGSRLLIRFFFSSLIYAFCLIMALCQCVGRSCICARMSSHRTL